MKLLLYLLQVAACTGVFYLFYFLFLSRLTFFSLNRWYLLGTLLLSFVVPLVMLPAAAIIPPNVSAAGVVAGAADFSARFSIPEASSEPEISAAPATTPAAQDQIVLKYDELLLGLYLLVAAVFAFRLLRSLVLLLVRLRSADVTVVGAIRLVRGSRHLSSGSFFSFVFLAEEGLTPGEVQQVLAHEAVHVRQLHSLDKLLAELVQVVLWFNPFAYAYTRAIELNHEFEVDARVAAQHDKKNYAELLLRLAENKPMLFHQFQASPLHKRVKMLFHKPSSNMKKLAYLFALPLVAAALFAFAGRSTETVQVSPDAQVSDISNHLAEEATATVEEVSGPEATNASIERQKDKTQFAMPTPQQAAALADYKQVNKIEVGKTTKEEIVTLFGPPLPEPVNDHNLTEWRLQTTTRVLQTIRLSVGFDKDNKVSYYFYSSIYKLETLPELTEDKVRSIKMKATTVEDVINTFGQPSRVILHSSTLYFEYTNRPYTSFLLSFDKSSPAMVNSINFNTQSNVPVEIDSTNLTNIKKGETSPEAVLKVFGKPNRKRIESNGERWFYTSKDSELWFDFLLKENSQELYLDDFKYAKLYKFSKIVNP